jgi:Zn-dependent protease
LTARQLRKVDLQLSGVEPDAGGDVPPELRAAFDAAAAELEADGFSERSHARIRPMLRTSGGDVWGAVLWNETWRSFATLTTAGTPDPSRPLSVAFWTQLRDATRLLTSNGEAWAEVGEDPRTQVGDAYAHGLRAHFDAHCRRLVALPGERQPVRATRAQLDAATAEGSRARIDGMVAAGDLVATGDGAWRFTWGGALRWARRFRERSRPYRRWAAEAKRRTRDALVAPTSSALLVDAFYRTRDVEQGRRAGAGAKGLVLLATLALFALSFAGGFDATGLAVLTAVILFHELGHWVAMRIFGYRDTSIFFIPFFGAATSGENPDASATQRMLVYLMGPVPGIALGLLLGEESGLAGALWLEHPEILAQATSMLLWVNCFNLLPILPFDGGHIARLLLFGRHPLSDVTFRVAALVAMAAIATWLGAPILWAFVALSAIALPQALRTAKLGRALARELRGRRLPERSLVERAFAWIEAGRMRSLAFAQKYALVRDVLREGAGPPPSAIATACFAALYLVCLTIAPAVMVARVVAGP